MVEPSPKHGSSPGTPDGQEQGQGAMVEPSPKRARTEPGVFSMDTDLDIVVEDETFHVHSLLLMLASPVFQKMLTTDMGEGRRGEITLPDKKKSEFRAFLETLHPCRKVDLTKESAEFLACWAEEYQVEGLKSQCDVYLVKHGTVSGQSLKHAANYSMPKWKKKCLNTIKSDIADHVDGLDVLVSESTKEELQELWPILCRTAGLELLEMPSIAHVRAMWAFVARAVKANHFYKHAKLRARHCNASQFMQSIRDDKSIPQA